MLSLFKMDAKFFIYLLLFSLVICSATPVQDDSPFKAQNIKVDTVEKSTSKMNYHSTLQEEAKPLLPKSIENSHSNPNTIKPKEPVNKDELVHRENDLKTSNGDAFPDSKRLPPITNNKPVNSLGNKNDSDIKKTSLVPGEKNSSALPVGAGQIPLPESSAGNEREQIKLGEKDGNVQSLLTKQQDQASVASVASEKKLEQPPLVSEKVVHTLPKQPLQELDKGNTDIRKENLDRAEERKKLEEKLRPYDYTEEDDSIQKEMELAIPDKAENKNFEPNPAYGNIGNDQPNNYNDNTIPKDVVNPARTIFPNKTGILYDDTNSHFFAYFLMLMVMAVLFYLLFHNKQRIIALMIEGRRGRPSRRGSARAKYHKLDNNLEEAMSSTRDGGVGNGGLGKIY